MPTRLALPLALALLSTGCSADNDRVLADAANDVAAAAATRQVLLGHAADLRTAVVALHAAAPSTGWTATSAPDSLAAMRDAWKQARRAYQGLEGMVDLAFPDLAASLDIRYDDALALGPDPEPLDDDGFVGLHAVERVLWADAAPIWVSAYEMKLPGYVPPTFPATDDQAADFKNELCARLVSDVEALQDRLAQATIDSPTAYEVHVRQVEGQIVKLVAAGAGKDVSRYADYTFAEMRADLAAAKAGHAAFRSWLLTKPTGAHLNDEIAGGFARLDQAYAAYPGDALPPVPDGWSSVGPSDLMKMTPFGILFRAVGVESDDTRDGSLAHSMDEAIEALGITIQAADAGAPPHVSTDPT